MNQNDYPNTPAPNCYPPYPPQPLVPIGLVNHILATERCLGATCLDNQHLQQKLAQRASRDEAFSKSLELADQCTYTIGPSGTYLLLMNWQVEQVLRIIPVRLFAKEPFYLIWFKNTDKCIQLSENEYLSDKKLLSALQEISGLEITVRKSLKRTAMLLRDAFSRCMRAEILRFYEGWRVRNPENPVFRVFPNGSTHKNFGSFNLSLNGDPVKPVSAACAAISAKQFWPRFNIISDLFFRYVTALWVHYALLYSLLRRLGFNTTVGLYLFAPDENLRSYLQKLLSWFGDAPISLDLPRENFSKELLSRKDEPLLVLDQGRLTDAEFNVRTLETALVHGKILFDCGSDDEMRPILAPLTFLSNRTSAIGFMPEAIILDFPADMFNREDWFRLYDHCPDQNDYLFSFAAFTQEHIPQLQAALEEGQRIAFRCTEEDLGEKYRTMFGIFVGLSSFLQNFFEFCGMIPPPGLRDESFRDKLLGLLLQASDKEPPEDIVEQFIAVAHRQIRDNRIQLSPKEYVVEQSCPVFYDRSCLYFSPSAFQSVCHALVQSRPEVIDALQRADLCPGKKVNANSDQVRITVQKKGAASKVLRVYGFKRSAFDSLGDPLVIEDEEVMPL